MQSLLKTQFPFDTFSRYRTELMGIAMFQIIIWHIVDGWTSYSDFFSTLDGWTCVLFSTLGTPGFLFFSGFGLFYSFSKEGNIKRFYIKRIKRVFIPYVLVTLLWYLIKNFIINISSLTFVLDITAISFWFYGNEWYISISLVLYFLFPLLFKAINSPSITKAAISSSLIIVFYWIIIIMLKDAFPNYYSMVDIGLSKVQYFIIGVFFGKLAFENRRIYLSYLFLLSMLLYVVHVWIKHRYYLQFGPMLLYDTLYHFSLLVFMVILCYLPNIIKKMNLWTWMGRYSLELYLLHMYLYKIFTRYYILDNAVLVTIILTFVLAVPCHKLSEKLVGSKK